jgi:hypothetical protein
MTIHIPVPWSQTDAPSRVGGESGAPLMLDSPLNAWIRGSYPGRALSGPPCPKAEISQ